MDTDQQPTQAEGQPESTQQESPTPHQLKKPLPKWPFAVLALALLWSFLIRWPLIANASAHIDSDLAVDGLTLLGLTQGQFRWHYPGTPHIGIAPALASLPQALALGTTPETLVSGGAVIQALVMIACFVLAWRCNGPAVACWSLVPLTFASTGLLWLSGRITGGHLLSVAMHAGIFIGFQAVLARPSIARAVALGVWVGLSLWVDSMAILSLAALVPAGLFAWWSAGHSIKALRYVLFFAIGMPLGLAPKWIGKQVDPYDSYNEQFSIIWEPKVLLGHARLLVLDCLPRLVAGHRIPNLRTDPPAFTMPTAPGSSFDRDRRGTFDEIPAHLAVLFFFASMIYLGLGRDNLPSASVRLGLMVASLLVLVGFILNRNIFNSDNYRYLVFLIVPWSLGFGRALARLATKGTGGMLGAAILTVAFAVTMTIDVGRWYQGFGWVVGTKPVVAKFERPELTWLNNHREVDGLIAGYWDVYLYSFLTGGRLKGIPYPIYPNRFPEWTATWPDQRPHYLLFSRGRARDGGAYRAAATRDGGVPLFQSQYSAIYTWPGSGPISP